ncbi:MAG: tetratricopeptide repeat protein [Candidatus Thermoplasmatota archaeon]|nr:tetratricopeptide repeat protein [Candidatus Thermoplasmatota archaeon]
MQIGRGIEALIKPDISASQAAPANDLRARIKALEGELLDVKVSITAQKRELEGLRKDLTIKLMLNGKVDKTALLEAENTVMKLVERRDQIQKEIDVLRSNDYHHVEDTRSANVGTATKGVSPSTDLDMRMVRELLTDERPKLPPGPQERPPGDREYVEKLKDELSPRKDVMKLRIEAGRGRSPPASQPPAPAAAQVLPPLDIPVPQAGEDNTVPIGTPSSPTAPPKSTVAPKKVRVRMGTFKPLPQPKDKRMYEIIDRTIMMMETGDPAGAKEQLLKALTEYPMDDELLYHLGNAFFTLGDLENAELRFRKAVEKNPTSYRALNNLGIVLRKKGKREQAIRVLNQSLEVNNKYERAWFNLGTIFMEIEPPLLKEAQIFLKRALECDPGYQKAKEKLTECERMLQKAS